MFAQKHVAEDAYIGEMLNRPQKEINACTPDWYVRPVEGATP